MKQETLSLSDIRYAVGPAKKKEYIYLEEDVKEAVKKLKDRIVFNDIYTTDEIFRIINEVFGEKLT